MSDFLPDQAGSDERYHVKQIRTDGTGVIIEYERIESNRRNKEMRDGQKFTKQLDGFELPGGATGSSQLLHK
jgi:hypothetical protein